MTSKCTEYDQPGFTVCVCVCVCVVVRVNGDGGRLWENESEREKGARNPLKATLCNDLVLFEVCFYEQLF